MAGESFAISHPEYICIQEGDKTFYGCNQDWYEIEWRRRAGCGPVTATNILLYLRKRYGETGVPYQNGSVGEALVAMNDVFSYVKPTWRGLDSVKRFVNGVYGFGRSYGLSFWHQYLLVPPQLKKRPDLETVTCFIKEGLKNDLPIAFLNLHAGAVEAQLSSWHWVTVVGVHENAGEEVILRFFDQSENHEADLGKWLNTTKLGGGFTYFCTHSRR